MNAEDIEVLKEKLELEAPSMFSNHEPNSENVDEMASCHENFHYSLQQYYSTDLRWHYSQDFQGNPYPPSFYSYFDVPIEVKHSKKKDSSLRKGKWTMEEEKFTNKIISSFNDGTLQLPEGTESKTLRAYLSEILECDPMRITKKFAGAACLGKKVYREDKSHFFADEKVSTQKSLIELEAKFKEKLDKISKEKSLPEKNQTLNSGRQVANNNLSLPSSGNEPSLGNEHAFEIRTPSFNFPKLQRTSLNNEDGTCNKGANNLLLCFKSHEYMFSLPSFVKGQPMRMTIQGQSMGFAKFTAAEVQDTIPQVDTCKESQHPEEPPSEKHEKAFDSSTNIDYTNQSVSCSEMSDADRTCDFESCSQYFDKVGAEEQEQSQDNKAAPSTSSVTASTDRSLSTDDSSLGDGSSDASSDIHIKKSHSHVHRPMSRSSRNNSRNNLNSLGNHCHQIEPSDHHCKAQAKDNLGEKTSFNMSSFLTHRLPMEYYTKLLDPFNTHLGGAEGGKRGMHSDSDSCSLGTDSETVQSRSSRSYHDNHSHDSGMNVFMPQTRAIESYLHKGGHPHSHRSIDPPHMHGRQSSSSYHHHTHSVVPRGEAPHKVNVDAALITWPPNVSACAVLLTQNHALSISKYSTSRSSSSSSSSFSSSSSSSSKRSLDDVSDQTDQDAATSLLGFFNHLRKESSSDLVNFAQNAHKAQSPGPSSSSFHHSQEQQESSNNNNKPQKNSSNHETQHHEKKRKTSAADVPKHSSSSSTFDFYSTEAIHHAQSFFSKSDIKIKNSFQNPFGLTSSEADATKVR